MSETPNQSVPERIQALHAWYGQAMGTSFPLGPATERYWFDWIQAGFNGKQLRRVMVYLRKEIAANRRNPGALKLRNLINPEAFEEDMFLCGASLDPEVKLPPTLESEKKMKPNSTPRREAAKAQSSEIEIRAFDDRFASGRLGVKKS